LIFFDSLINTSEEEIKSLESNLKSTNDEYSNALKDNQELLKNLNENNNTIEIITNEYKK
jgi:septal ring factor EnvC (AmiA/AmiB activator)